MYFVIAFIRRRAIARPSKAIALAIARAMLDKKALDVQVLHVAPLTSIADYLVIGSAESDRQTRAIADSVAEVLSRVGQRPLSLEGTTSGQWVLIDFGDVVAHVFRHDTRSHYALERLWSDARSLPVPEETPASTATPKRHVIQKATSRKMV
ncbi:MAG TPA: ribosome silencing factor [Nitrospira sp.]|nr:ribosome silencing factor [Nitrospira sp.]